MEQLREAHEMLIFQHIPKTAGTTLSFILAQNFEEEDIYHIRNLKQMRGPAYSRHFGSVEDFAALDPDERNRFRCIIGHAPFGLHNHLTRPVSYITFLRDPVKRVISQYHQHQRMVRANELDDDQLTFEQFLELKPAVLNNHQTRFVSGVKSNSLSPEECYQKARSNIDEYFSLVGIVERFDESLLLLSKEFCLPRVTYVRRNTTARKELLSDIDPSIIDMIQQANHYDTLLYQYAVALLDEKIGLYGAEFGYDLRRFRRRQLLDTTRLWATKIFRGSVRRVIHAARSIILR